MHVPSTLPALRPETAPGSPLFSEDHSTRLAWQNKPSPRCTSASIPSPSACLSFSRNEASRVSRPFTSAAHSRAEKLASLPYTDGPINWWPKWKSSSWYVRLEAVRTIGKLEPAELARHSSALVEKLADEKSDVRLAAVQALSKLDPPELAKQSGALIERLEDADFYVRRAAAASLRNLDHAEIAKHSKVFIHKLGGTNLHARQAAAEALCKLDLTGHSDDLAWMLDHTDSNVRVAALSLLGSLSPADLTKHSCFLEDRLGDADMKVRWAGVEILERLKYTKFAIGPSKKNDSLGALLEARQQTRKAKHSSFIRLSCEVESDMAQSSRARM